MSSSQFSQPRVQPLQLCTWNLAGKPISSGVDLVFEDHYPEVLMFQEVGGALLSGSELDSQKPHEGIDLPPGTREVLFDNTHELSHYRVFAGDCESYLSQVIAIDGAIVDHIQAVHLGKRYLAVGFTHLSAKLDVLLISLHFPHSGASDDNYLHAVNDLTNFIQLYPRYVILLGGDWNAEPSQLRFDLCSTPLSLLGAEFHLPPGPTRFGVHSQRTFDYFSSFRLSTYGALEGDAFNLGSSELDSPDSRPRAIHDSGKELGSDHELVLWEVVLPLPLSASTSLRRSWTKGRFQCKRWMVNPCLIQRDKFLKGSIEKYDLSQQWQCMLRIAHQASYPMPSKKYQDSAFLKDLCSQRKSCIDPTRRACLSKMILAHRRLERDNWCQQLLRTAAANDYTAVRKSLSMEKPRAVFDVAYSVYGSKQSFDEAVVAHIKAKFGAASLPPDAGPSSQSIGTDVPINLTAALPFTQEEVLCRIHALKSQRTAGLSGLSADFIKVYTLTPQGLKDVVCVLNSMLSKGALAEQRLAIMMLAPKVSQASGPKSLRPLSMMESMHKLYMSLLVNRLQASWQPPKHQFGGYKGTQFLDSLFVATNKLNREALAEDEHIWVSADVEGAFDSVSWDAMRRALYSLTPVERHSELEAMLREVQNHRVLLTWQGSVTHIPLERGVLQGGTHSSQAFAAVLEHLFRGLHQTWAREFPNLIDAWVYIDDCLLRFKNWRALQDSLPWILRHFAAYGLQWNLAKTKLVSTPAKLREGRLLCGDGDLVSKFTWSTSFKYLGCSLQHPALYSEDGDTITDFLIPQCLAMVRSGIYAMRGIFKHCHWSRIQTGMALFDRYISSKWLWMCALLEPLRKHLDCLQALQHTVMCNVFKLYIPAALSESCAHALNRVRRRAMRELLRTHPTHKAWTVTWVKRRWSYYGHLLRRDASHQARRELLQPIRQHRPGRASLPQRWIIQCLRYALQWPALDCSHLSNLYLTKQEWEACLPSVLEHHGLNDCQACPTLTSATWQSWRRPAQIEVGWFWPVWVWESDGRLQFKWLDKEHGWMQLGMELPAPKALDRFLQYLPLAAATRGMPFALMLHASSHASFFPGLLLSLQGRVFSQLPVLLFEQVPPSWVYRVQCL